MRAIIEALGEGKIDLPKVGRIDGKARVAPSFTTTGKTESHVWDSSYTAASLAKFVL